MIPPTHRSGIVRQLSTPYIRVGSLSSSVLVPPDDAILGWDDSDNLCVPKDADLLRWANAEFMGAQMLVSEYSVGWGDPQSL